MNDKKIKELLKNKNFKIKLLILFILGVVFLYLGNITYPKKEEPPLKTVSENQTENEKSQNTEKKLKNILSKVEGAGNVEVMITYKSEREIVAAEMNDIESEQDKNKMRKKTKNEYVILEDEKGKKIPLVLKELSPEVEGVLIVAEGGDNIVVKDGLLKAAEALLGIPPHKIQILKMK